MSNIFYGHAPNMNGSLLLNLDCSDTHVSNINAKICEVNDDSTTYLCHYNLGHIGLKRMKKLYADELLETLDYESFKTCELCLMGK